MEHCQPLDFQRTHLETVIALIKDNGKIPLETPVTLTYEALIELVGRKEDAESRYRALAQILREFSTTINHHTKENR